MRRVYSILAVMSLLVCASRALCTVAETDPALRAFRTGHFDELEMRISALIAAKKGMSRELELYWELMERSVTAIELEPALGENLERWLRAAPRSANPYYVMASIELNRAWKFQDQGNANGGSDAALSKYREHMQAADEILAKARKIDPRNIAIAVERIHVATYRFSDLRKIESRFEEALAIDPASESAHRAMRIALGPKWHRTNEMALEFMRDAVRRHPDSPALGSLLADVHIDLAFQRRRSSSDVSAYLIQPKVWEEILTALQRYAAAHPEDALAHNRLAWLAWRGGRRDLAKREFKILDGDFIDSAWEKEFPPEQAMAWAESPTP